MNSSTPFAVHPTSVSFLIQIVRSLLHRYAPITILRFEVHPIFHVLFDGFSFTSFPFSERFKGLSLRPTAFSELTFWSLIAGDVSAVPLF
jgi:hypothetical protein